MEKWIGFELHPETPKSGVKIAELLPEVDLDLMNRNLNANGNPYGVSFKRNDFLPNTRLALEASEFARAYNKFTEFHDRTFKAYFTKGQDIGNIMVLLNLAQEIGLDKAKLEEDLNNHTYAEVVEQNRTAAVKNNVTAIPTFIIADKIRITGANPYSRFQKALEEIIKP